MSTPPPSGPPPRPPMDPSWGSGSAWDSTPSRTQGDERSWSSSSRPPSRPAVPTSYGDDWTQDPKSGGGGAFAVVALVVAVVLPLAGLILGLTARRRIAAARAEGRKPAGASAARAAVVVGSVLTLVQVALVVAAVLGLPQQYLPTRELSAAEVQTRMVEQIDLPGTAVACPGPLPAEFASRITCAATRNGETASFDAVVTYAQGGSVLIAVTRS